MKEKKTGHTHLNSHYYFVVQTLNWFKMLNHHGPGIAVKTIDSCKF